MARRTNAYLRALHYRDEQMMKAAYVVERPIWQLYLVLHCCLFFLFLMLNYLVISLSWFAWLWTFCVFVYLGFFMFLVPVVCRWLKDKEISLEGTERICKLSMWDWNNLESWYYSKVRQNSQQSMFKVRGSVGTPTVRR